MGSPYNVLVFPAGEINSVELYEALSRQVNIRLFGASSIDRIGRYLFRNYRGDLPLISDARFFDNFNLLLRRWSIDLVIPTHDTVVEFFSDHRDNVAATLLLPAVETATICRDKRLTYRTFADCPFTPRVFTAPGEADRQAVFVKPPKGQGAAGARLIPAGAPAFAAIRWGEEIVSEYLPGEELTVDCLTDAHGGLLGVYPRSRERTLGGVSVAGRALRASEEVVAIARAINERLRFLGMWYFQLKRDAEGAYKLLEVSARCSGSQCLTRARGVNLPLLSVYIAMGREVTVSENCYEVRMDRTLTAVYDISYEYDHVYIDYDDTIITPRGVDPDIMRLLYQFRNDGKKVTLLTRHATDLRESLRERAIPETLFFELVHLRCGEPKANYVTGARAIFIDNAFSERLAVQQAHHIPVFDVDTTQALHKWMR